MNCYVRNLLLTAWMILLMMATVSQVHASSFGRYLYDLDPYEVDPKSWAVWRHDMTPEEWQQWCDELNEQRWSWWRESMGPKNWNKWKETMGPQDKALWDESTKLLPQIQAREEQTEPAKHFKSRVIQLKQQGKVIQKQP